MPSNNPISPEALRALQQYMKDNPTFKMPENLSGVSDYNATKSLGQFSNRGTSEYSTIFDYQESLSTPLGGNPSTIYDTNSQQPSEGTPEYSTIFDAQGEQGQYSGVEDVMKDYYDGNINDTQLDKVLQEKNYSGQGDTQGGLGNNQIGADGTLYTDNLSKYKEKGKVGNILGGAAYDLSEIIGGFREGLSIAGSLDRNKYMKDYYQSKGKEQRYTPISQTENSNYKGGLSYGEIGGEMGLSLDKYPFGGRYGERDWVAENSNPNRTDASYVNSVRKGRTNRRGFLDSAVIAMKQNKENRQLEDNPWRRIRFGEFKADTINKFKFEEGGYYADGGGPGDDRLSRLVTAREDFVSQQGTMPRDEFRERLMEFDKSINNLDSSVLQGTKQQVSTDQLNMEVINNLQKTEEGRQLLEISRQSGRTVSEYIQENGINTNNFKYADGGGHGDEDKKKKEGEPPLLFEGYDFNRELREYNNNPRVGGIPQQGGNYQKISDTDRSEILKQYDSRGTSNLSEAELQNYYELSDNNPYFVDPDRPNIFLARPVDLFKYRKPAVPEPTPVERVDVDNLSMRRYSQITTPTIENSIQDLYVPPTTRRYDANTDNWVEGNNNRGATEVEFDKQKWEFAQKNKDYRQQQIDERKKRSNFGFAEGGRKVPTISPENNPMFKEGEYITFEDGGKTYSGIIKKFENGKIYI